MASKRKRCAAGKRGVYRKYTVKQRRAALRDADKLGLLAVAEQHGIPITTLKNWWKRKAGLSAVTAKASPVEPHKPSRERVSPLGFAFIRRKNRLNEANVPSPAASIRFAVVR